MALLHIEVTITNTPVNTTSKKAAPTEEKISLPEALPSKIDQLIQVGKKCLSAITWLTSFFT